MTAKRAEATNSALMTLDAVMFDFDGVIVESNTIKTEAFRDLFANEREHVDAIVALHRRHAGVSRLVKFDMIYRAILRRPLAADERDELGVRFQRMVMEKVVACPMVPGALELLQSLAGCVPMAVVSGTPEGELREIVMRRGLEKFFFSISGTPRTKREIVSALLKDNGWRADRVLMVGDAIEDLNGAQANGVPFVGRVPKSDANPFPADIPAVEDLSGVAGAIERLARPVIH